MNETEIIIRKTDEVIPEEDQEVMYWFAPFEKWFFGRFDGEWTFYSKFGFCDGHDAPYWIDSKELPDPRWCSKIIYEIADD